MPDSPSFRYNAFIIYRHVEPDRHWAKWLHSALETYRVPKKLAQQRGLPTRVQRVFRDEDELPASSDLNQQIESGPARFRQFLIVICSPRTSESLWVNKEIERFRELGRDDRILALLIEGAPKTSFPRALREIRPTPRRRYGNHPRANRGSRAAGGGRAERPERKPRPFGTYGQAAPPGLRARMQFR